MPTVLDVLGTSTPVSEVLAQKLGYVKAAIACRVYFYQQLERGVCDASIATIAQKLGMSNGCVSINIKWLVDNGYIKELGKHKKGNSTNSYRVTGLFYSSLRSLGERDVHEMNVDVHEMNGEEDIKEDKRTQMGPLNQALIDLCVIDPAMLINGLKLDYQNLIRVLIAKDTEPAIIQKFGLWWGDGDPPTLKQVAENWALFEQGKQRRFKNGQHKNGSGKRGQGNRTKTPTGAGTSGEFRRQLKEL